MPLILTDPLVISVSSHAIKQINIDLENNQYRITIADISVNNTEIRRHTLSLSIFDDFGNVMVPGAWPETNPTGAQMYALIQQFLFLGAQEQPGDNGLGPGVIT